MNPEPAHQPRPPRPFRVFLLTFGLILTGATYVQFQILPAVRGLDATIQEQNQRLDRIEDSIALLHYSNLPGKSSQEAILDFIKYWSDQMSKHGYNRATAPAIDEKLDLATKALTALGKPAYAAVETAFLEALSDNEEQEAYRELLMNIAAELDKKEAADLASEVLSNRGVRSDMRNHAARTLLELDSMRAGRLLKDIILNESHQGMVKPQPIFLNQTFKKLPPGIVPRSFPGFFNNINYLMRSDYSGKEDVLLTVLQQDWHNISTYSAVVEGLRTLKSQRGAKLFKRLFVSGVNDMQASMVRSKMAYSIIEILGKDACSWLREAYTSERDQRVRGILGGLIRDYCR